MYGTRVNFTAKNRATFADAAFLADQRICDFFSFNGPVTFSSHYDENTKQGWFRAETTTRADRDHATRLLVSTFTGLVDDVQVHTA